MPAQDFFDNATGVTELHQGPASYREVSSDSGPRWSASDPDSDARNGLSFYLEIWLQPPSSILLSVPSSELVTQIAPAAYATSVGPRPVSTRKSFRFEDRPVPPRWSRRPHIGYLRDSDRHPSMI